MPEIAATPAIASLERPEMVTAIETPTLVERPPASIEAEILAMLPVLNDAHKKTPPGPRTEALEALIPLIEGAEFKAFEPFIVKHLLPVILKRCDDKPKVTAAAKAAGEKLMSTLSVQAFPAVFPALFAELTESAKWKSKLAATELLGLIAQRVSDADRDLLSACLPELIPVVSALLYDTKPEINDAAEATLRTVMQGITNRDLEPFVERLIVAMKDREETNETIQSLGGVVFVQTVEGSALSVVVPLILAGLRQKTALIKRMCARIVGNMSKLVEEPLEAAPFLGDLIPALFEAIDTIADPEAREVATQTHAQLVKIETAAKEAAVTKAGRVTSVIAANLSTELGVDAESPAAVTVAYIAEMCASLIRTKTNEPREWQDELSPLLGLLGAADKWEWCLTEALKVMTIAEADDEADDGTELCNCEFTLAYGTKILLHNTKLRLLKGMKYGLLGQNDCGKTTLMRAIAEGSVDGFPDASEVRTVFVEADIQGELSHLDCVNYVLEYGPIKAGGFTEADVRRVLLSVGFTEGKAAGAGGDCDDPISSLSGGWRMKLALARAMLQRADILLMDEPTNHLDVANVKWVKSYINSLTDVTCVMVSHDPSLLDECCTHILQIDKLKLHSTKGNLTSFRATHPEVESFFSFKASKFAFKFPQPSFLDGVKSRGKALLKMDNVQFTYPGNSAPTIKGITIRASMGSRVAVVGKNGAGKSTMIKVLTGELEPDKEKGIVWKYPNSKIGYIAQHAFVHIEQHLQKTPNEYIRWRYEFGDDREGLDNAAMKLSEEDEAELKKPVDFTFKDAKGNLKKEPRVIHRATGQRRENPAKKGEQQYEVQWVDKPVEANSWYTADQLLKFNPIYRKIVRIIDHKILARESMFQRPLTQANVERHLADVGLEPEYGTHFRMGALSGGQKVKVVLAAAMWDQPHIIILDEPTNYLDRESLGALAKAIEVYEGGVIMITHNDAFCRELCPERWVLEAGNLNTEGDVEWMNKLADSATSFEQVEEMVDASGNEVKVKKALNAKQKKKLIKTIKDKIAKGVELDEDEESYAIEWNL